MGPRVRIVTDSVADLPPDYADEHQIRVLPVYLTVNGQTFLDDGSLDRDWFYGQLDQVSERPTTAAPAPQEFQKVYEGLASEGAEEIIALFTASTLSSLYNHAVIAAQQFDQGRVHVVDTAQVSVGVGLQVMAAAEMVTRGEPVARIVERVEVLRKRTRILGVLESADYLRRSGRVRWGPATMAHLLRIKPLIGFYDGAAQSLGRVRTLLRGVRAIVERISTIGALERLAILHTRTNAEAVCHLQECLAARYPGTRAPVIDVGAVFAAHIGPGCLGVALIADDGATS